MRISLDGTEMFLPEAVLAQGKKAVFEAVKKEALVNNCVIVGITVDGSDIDDEESFCSLAGGLDVGFTSQPVRELVGESLAEGNRYLPLLTQGISDIATLFEAGRKEDAQAKLLVAIEGINWLVGVFDKSCVLLGQSPDQLKSGDFMQDRSNLNQVLTDMVLAMENDRTLDLAFLLRERLVAAVGSLAGYWAEISVQTEGPLQ